MKKTVAGTIVGIVIILIVIIINVVLGKDDKQEQQQPPQQSQQAQQNVEQTNPLESVNPNAQVGTQNQEEINKGTINNGMTNEEVQKYIQEQIQQGIAQELAKNVNGVEEQVIDNTQQTVENKPVEQQTPNTQKQEPVTSQQQSTNNIELLPIEEMNTIVFTKTEDVAVVDKVIRKVTLDGVTSTTYEIKVNGSTYPVLILVNNTAYNSVKVGDKLKITYNTYKSTDGSTYTNLVKLGQ